MSDFSALRRVSLALAGWLRQRFIADPQLNPLFTGGHVVSLRTPKEMREPPPEVGLSLWLYLVERDGFLHNRPPERVDSTHIRLTPLPLDLHYLVTPITEDPEAEQLIMGKVFQIFHEHATFPVDPDHPELEDELRISLESLDLESITRVWSALDEPYQLCASYLVQAVNVEPGEEPVSTTPVLEKRSEYDQILEVT
jgi:Pvc16 N-terminal domain